MYQKNSQNYVGIRSPSGDCGNGIFEMQIFLDFVSDLRGRRGRHRQKRSLRRNFAQFVQQVVVGAEVVSPLADAVRLVDGETRNSVGSTISVSSSGRLDTISGVMYKTRICPFRIRSFNFDPSDFVTTEAIRGFLWWKFFS